MRFSPQIFNGFRVGSILLLLALGLAISFGQIVFIQFRPRGIIFARSRNMKDVVLS